MIGKQQATVDVIWLGHGPLDAVRFVVGQIWERRSTHQSGLESLGLLFRAYLKLGHPGSIFRVMEASHVVLDYFFWLFTKK